MNITETSKRYCSLSTERIQEIADTIPPSAERSARVMITCLCLSHEALRREMAIVDDALQCPPDLM